MNARDAIAEGLKSSKGMVDMYLSDLSDADLLVRPAPGANHIAWQMGHLIASEQSYFGNKIPGVSYPALPEGFGDRHGKTAALADPPKDFLSKSDYLKLFGQVREATLAAASKLSEADLDKPTGIDFAPTVGKLLVTLGVHTMMHAGQFTVVRRKLGKPVLF